MGSVISRWKKNTSTAEILEEIDKEISKIEKFRRSTQELRSRVIGNLILYSILIYVIACFALYFLFIPTDLFGQCLQILPMLFFPLLIYLLKRVLHWWFVRRISKNELQMKELKEQRKEILENVMETETYKKAKEILEKFDPVTKKKLEEERRQADKPLSPSTNDMELRRRNVPTSPSSPRPPVNPPVQSSPGNVTSPPGLPQMTPGPMRTGPRPPMTPILPRPLLRQNRTPLEKFVEYFVGDGPTNRYALICSNCYSHNGMALKEEFEYVEYRCAYCRFFNAARKQRPTAPRLPVRVDSPMIRRHRSDSQDNNVCKNIDFSSLTELSPDDAEIDNEPDQATTALASNSSHEGDDELSSGDKGIVSVDHHSAKDELTSHIKNETAAKESPDMEETEN